MNRIFSVVAAAVTIAVAVAWSMGLAEWDKKEIVGLTPDKVRWFAPPYYNDGRQRAQLFGDSSHDGAWVDRVKNTKRFPCPRAHSSPGRTSYRHRRCLVSGRGSDIRPCEANGLPSG